MAFPYQKHIWVTKEVIRREYLQNIEDGIYDEQQDRLTQEEALNQAIIDEESRARRAEQTITNAVDAETLRATAAENSLSADITTERTRALSVESDLRDDITNLSGRITDESTRAVSAEQTLTNNLSSEITRATAAEEALSSRITTETTRATGAESTLQTAINNETSRATAAESGLHDYVDQKIATTYKPRGSVFFADLPPITPERSGNVYNIKDAFTTTSDFAEGAGKSYPAGSNVAIEGIEGDFYEEVTPVGDENPEEEGWYEYNSQHYQYELTADTEVVSGKTYYSYEDLKYMYDVMAGMIDTSHFVSDTDYATAQSAGIVKPDGTTITADNDGTLHSVGGGQGSAEAAERMIAPIEPDATASAHVYTVGEQLILNEVLYDVIASIAIGDALVTGTGGNIKAADNVTTQLGTKYDTEDSASTTINDTDYVPMSESSGTKKKTLWSTIVAKIKTALGIVSGGTGFLKKDGTWGTPTNTTYSFAAGDNNGQIKVTPSGGSAQNVSVKGLGSAAYTASTDYLKQHGWASNNVALSSLENGTYKISPNQIVTEVKTLCTSYGLSEYGTVRVSAQGAYPIYEYVDVFGNTAVRNTKQGGWAVYYSTENKPTKSDVGLGNVDNTADSSKSVNYANSAGSANAVAWGNVTSKPSSYTPSSHASLGTGYGAATSEYYGHVVLTDDYTINHGDANMAVGASSKALYDVYTRINIRDWIPYNGYNPLGESDVVFAYSVNPNLMIAQGKPGTNFSEYGTVFGFKGPLNYAVMFYMDVFGRLAVWEIYSGSKWTIIKDIA